MMVIIITIIIIIIITNIIILFLVVVAIALYKWQLNPVRSMHTYIKIRDVYLHVTKTKYVKNTHYMQIN